MGIFNYHWVVRRKKTQVATVRVHTASATAEKGKLWILNPGPHRVDFFSKYGHAVYHSKALEELNNFYKRTIG